MSETMQIRYSELGHVKRYIDALDIDTSAQERELAHLRMDDLRAEAVKTKDKWQKSEDAHNLRKREAKDRLAAASNHCQSFRDYSEKVL